MTLWTVFKVRWLLMGGAGQSLEKVGTVEAADINEAMDKAHREFEEHTNPTLPNNGLLVRAARSAKRN